MGGRQISVSHWVPASQRKAILCGITEGSVDLLNCCTLASGFRQAGFIDQKCLFIGSQPDCKQRVEARHSAS